MTLFLTTHDLIYRRSLQLKIHSVPLFWDNEKGTPELLGSSLLVKKDNQLFLVTAAHVLDPIKENRRIFFYPNHSTIIEIGGTFLMSSPNPIKGCKGDKVDLAIWHVPEEYQSLIELYKAVPISQLKLDSFEYGNKMYGVIGYPASMSKTNHPQESIFTESLLYFNSALETIDYKQFGVECKTHIVIKYDRKRVVGSDGTQQISPDPHGLSGSPVWSFRLVDDANLIESVAGIVIEHIALHRGIIATQVQHVLTLLEESH